MPGSVDLMFGESAIGSCVGGSFGGGRGGWPSWVPQSRLGGPCGLR